MSDQDLLFLLATIGLLLIVCWGLRPPLVKPRESEHLCPSCGGSGRRYLECWDCEGTGKEKR